MALPCLPLRLPLPHQREGSLALTGPVEAHRRILVVDDSDAIRADFRKILVPDPRAEVSAMAEALFDDRRPQPASTTCAIEGAAQGDEAVALVQARLREGRPFSVAFVDLRMPPGWDGVETIAQLWKTDPDLQVVLCTAYSDYSWEQMIAALGETDRFIVLKKPFDTIEVQQLASALTEKWKLLQLTRVRCETLEKTAESSAAELRRSEERFRVLADHSNDIIAIMTTEGARIYTSPSYERLLGYSESRLSSAPACTLYHQDDQVAVLLALQSTGIGGDSRTLEYRMQHGDGSWRRFEAEFTFIREGYGAGNVLIVARDVTDKRAAQDELRRTARELERACRFEPIRELVPGLAEQLSAPARTMSDNVEFVQEGFRELRKLFTAQQRLIEALQSGTDTTNLVREVEAAAHCTDSHFLAQEIPRAIEETMQGVAQVARIAGALQQCAEPEPDQRATIDLHTALDSVITLAAPAWRRTARVVTEFDSAVPPLSCLPTDLKLALLQLLLHCSRSISSEAPGLTTLQVATRFDGGFVEIRVRADGVLFAPEIEQCLAHPQQSARAGHPLHGLASAHATITRLHGGSLKTEADEKHGSAFVVRLPSDRSSRAGAAA